MMTNASAAPARPEPFVPAELVELVLEFALAVHKRAIYPTGHPMLRGAAAGLGQHTRRIADRVGVVRFAVSPTAILIDDVPADPSNPLLREFAEHLHEHQLAAIRILPGVEDAEIEDLLTTLATSARRVDQPLGALGEEALSRWRHVALHPIDYESLGFSDGASDRGTGAPLDPRAATLWADLARMALIEPAEGAATPADIAAAIGRHAGTADYARGVLSALSRATQELGGPPSAASQAMRDQLSDVIQALEPDVLARLLEVGSDRANRARLLEQALDIVDAEAMVRLVAAGATAGGTTISQSMLRLLSKLARNANDRRHVPTAADLELRDQLRRLLQHWTLEDPNPASYRDALTYVSLRGAANDAVDEGRDDCEPDRLIEISLDAGQGGEATDRALARMVATQGLAQALDRLAAYPASPVRDRLIDRLANGETLQEQLADDEPDVRVLRHLVARLGRRAVDPLLQALEARPVSDADWIAELLVSVGLDAVAPLSSALPAASSRVQYVLLGVFDRLEAWPDVPSLRDLGSHPEPALRREALRLMLKHETLREDAMLAAAADTDDRIFGLALATASRGTSPRVAAALMHRLDADDTLGRELRGRAVRAIAASGSLDGMRWIVGKLVRRHWLTRRLRIQRRSTETVAGLAGLAVHWSASPEAAVVLALGRRSRDAEVRRAASLPSAPR